MVCVDAPSWQSIPVEWGSFGENPLNTESIEARWAQWHAETPPIGFLLREAYPDRWLRVYSLPEGKRYATSVLEHAEVLHRHRVVAEDVLGPTPDLVTLFSDATDGHWVACAAQAMGLSGRDFPRLWELAPEWWDEERGTFDCPVHIFGAAGPLSAIQFDRFVSEIAEDRCRAIVSDLNSGRVYAPYDGGADLIYATEVERDLAAQRLAEWRSGREDGL